MSDLSKLQALMPLWLNAQRPMNEVVRWGNFPDYGQTLLMHANSFPLVGMMFTAQLRATGRKFDESLLALAFLLHDHGEPPTGGDQHAGNKTVDKPILEWQAFWEMTEGLLQPFRYQSRLAFSLQYCRKTIWEKLPEPGRHMVIDLKITHVFEAAVFEFCERVDYLMSALEGHRRKIRNQEETIISHTVNNQIPRLDGLVEEFPELEIIWTERMRQEFLDLVAKDR